MDLRAAREHTGISEKTLRKWIKQGKLEATMRITDHGRQWDISTEAVEGLSRDHDGMVPEDRLEGSGSMTEPGTCENCDWLRTQIDTKDQQVRELHILLQQAQEQVNRMLPAPQPRRWWWPFSGM